MNNREDSRKTFLTVFNTFINALMINFTYAYKPKFKLNVALQTVGVTISESIASYISHVNRLYRLNEYVIVFLSTVQAEDTPSTSQ